jgi:hypothetical protein
MGYTPTESFAIFEAWQKYLLNLSANDTGYPSSQEAPNRPMMPSD